MLEAARNVSSIVVGRNKKGKWHVWKRMGNWEFTVIIMSHVVTFFFTSFNKSCVLLKWVIFKYHVYKPFAGIQDISFKIISLLHMVEVVIDGGKGVCVTWFELLAFIYNILIAEFLLLHPLPQDYAYSYKKGYYYLLVMPQLLRHITFTFRYCEISAVIGYVAAVETDLYQTMVKSGLHSYMCLLYKMCACYCMSVVD